MDAGMALINNLDVPEQSPTIVPSYRIPQNVQGTDGYKPNSLVLDGKYRVSEDGLTANLITQKSS